MPWTLFRRSLIRSALACVLAVVLPAKAIAAVAMPITGMPNHVHGAEGRAMHLLVDINEHTHQATSSTEGHCSAHAYGSPEDGGSLHDHACPHLGMASVASALPDIELQSNMPIAPSFVDTPHDSVVFDVPSPPPTAIL